MGDRETFREVCQIGAIAAGSALVIFGLGSRRFPPGFRPAPLSSGEWIAYWFHTLEFLACCLALLTWNGAFYYLPDEAGQIVAWIFMALPPALFLSAIVFWKRERRLCMAGLAWAIITTACLFFPAVPVTKAA